MTTSDNVDMHRPYLQISKESLKTCYAMTLRDTALKLNVCEATFKRHCRSNGIARWPYRRIQALRQAMQSNDKVGKSLTKDYRISKKCFVELTTKESRSPLRNKFPVREKKRIGGSVLKLGFGKRFTNECIHVRGNQNIRLPPLVLQGSSKKLKRTLFFPEKSELLFQPKKLQF